MIIIFLTWVAHKLQIFSDLIVVPGWATIAMGMFFLGSIQLIAIGVLGEYISRTFDQTKGRPIYIVREKSDKDE